MKFPLPSVKLRPALFDAPLVTSCSCPVANSSPVAVPVATEGSDVGGVGAASTAAGGPTPLPLTCVPLAVTSAAGTAAVIPPPREDVTVATEVVVASDENMGGMPPPRGAADAAGAAAGKLPPREDVASANEVGAAPD